MEKLEKSVAAAQVLHMWLSHVLFPKLVCNTSLKGLNEK